VVQRPNAGSSAPSEGFALSGSTVKLSAAPPSGSDYFAIVLGSTVNIGTPSDNTVTSAILQNGSVIEAKLGSGAVTQAKIGDQAINEAKLQVSNAPTNGYFLSAQSGNTGGLTWAQVSTDLVADTSPQLGGDLDTNSFEISLDDSHNVIFGDGDDFKIRFDGTNSIVEHIPASGYLGLQADDLYLQDNTNGHVYARCIRDAQVELYYDNSKKFETTSAGAHCHGNLDFFDDHKVRLGTSSDLQVYHDGSNSYVKAISGGAGDLFIFADGKKIYLRPKSGEDGIKIIDDGAVELYYDGSKKLETTSNGIKVNNRIEVIANAIVDNTANGNNVGILFASESILPATGAGSLTNASKDLGSSSYRWRNIYTNDLNLSNEGSSNDVDGTWGSYTIQEGAEDLFLINKRNGKKYKFNLTEVS